MIKCIGNEYFYIRKIEGSDYVNEIHIPLENNPFETHPYLTKDLQSIKINAKHVNICLKETSDYIVRYEDDSLESSHFINKLDHRLVSLITNKQSINKEVTFELDNSLKEV